MSPPLTPQSSARTRVLIMSVGSLVATNVLEGLARLGRERFFVIGVNCEAAASNNFACDVSYLVPPASAGSAYHDALRVIGATEQPEIWIPGRDDDVLALADMAASQALPGVPLVGSPAAAAIICDKWLSYCFARAHGLNVAPSARTLTDAIALADHYGYPLLVKPRRGFGSIGTRFVTSVQQLTHALSGDDCIAQVAIGLDQDWQQSLPDLEAGWPLWYSHVDTGQFSSQWMIAQDGATIEIGAVQHTMIYGRTDSSICAPDAALSAMTAAYAQALAMAGWRGPLNVQCRKDQHGNFYMFELSGRFNGGTGSRDVLGLEETATVFSSVFPTRFFSARPALHPATRLVKQLCSAVIAGADMQQLQECGVWHSASASNGSRT